MTTQTTIRQLDQKILLPEQFIEQSMALRKKGKTVFTNGCFDLVHLGHITYLAEAKDCGDFLLVALNSDESIRLLKGENRPLIPLKQRLKAIAALFFVDFVTWFEDQTPANLIDACMPHVLVKGGDYDTSKIVGSETVIKNGGEVHSLKFVPNLSTSKILADWVQKNSL